MVISKNAYFLNRMVPVGDVITKSWITTIEFRITLKGNKPQGVFQFVARTVKQLVISKLTGNLFLDGKRSIKGRVKQMRWVR